MTAANNTPIPGLEVSAGLTSSICLPRPKKSVANEPKKPIHRTPSKVRPRFATECSPGATHRYHTSPAITARPITIGNALRPEVKVAKTRPATATRPSSVAGLWPLLRTAVKYSKAAKVMMAVARMAVGRAPSLKHPKPNMTRPTPTPIAVPRLRSPPAETEAAWSASLGAAETSPDAEAAAA